MHDLREIDDLLQRSAPHFASHAALLAASATLVAGQAYAEAPPARTVKSKARVDRFDAAVEQTQRFQLALVAWEPEAGEAGADYVAFGAFFPTATKVTEYRAEPDLLTWWQDLMEIPCVAIGGITPENCAPLVRAGADFLAVSGAVWNGDEVAAVKAFHAAIAGAN